MLNAMSDEQFNVRTEAVSFLEEFVLKGNNKVATRGKYQHRGPWVAHTIQ